MTKILQKFILFLYYIFVKNFYGLKSNAGMFLNAYEIQQQFLYRKKILNVF